MASGGMIGGVSQAPFQTNNQAPQNPIDPFNTNNQPQQPIESQQKIEIKETTQATPKFCSNCGQPTNGGNFCSNCGNKLI